MFKLLLSSSNDDQDALPSSNWELWNRGTKAFGGVEGGMTQFPWPGHTQPQLSEHLQLKWSAYRRALEM